jgi:protein-disulfide isomerase
MSPTNTEWILRYLLTAIAAVAIIGAAGAAYFVNHKSMPDKPGSSPVASSSVETVVGSSTAAAASGTESPPAATQTAQTDQPVIGPDEHEVGKADAPVTMIEYASMTCPHCEHFDTETMPRIKSEFIDKGLVRFVFRPFPLDKLALRASMMAECVPGEGYFSMIDMLFRSRSEWTSASDPLAALKQIGRTAGMSSADIDRCTADQAVEDRIIAGAKDAASKFGINSTPSFVINGKTYTNMPFDDYQDEGATKPGFSTIIRGLLPKS